MSPATATRRTGRRAARFIPADPVPDDLAALPRSPYLTPERLDAGLVVSLDGVGGYNWLPRWLRRGLCAGGVPAAIVIYNWSLGPLGMWATDLFVSRRNRDRAAFLADRIAAYRARWPGRPVTLIGHSAGGGIAAWTLEALGAACPVDRAMLLAPALSPAYNLAAALEGVRKRLYVTYSHLDVALMGLGTSLLGTIDRRHGPSAGLVGFRLPQGLTDDQRAAYAKVRQLKWRPRSILDGHWGDHTGCTTPTYARRVLAPIVLGRSDPGEPVR
jgi:hypothetical protein